MLKKSNIIILILSILILKNNVSYGQNAQQHYKRGIEYGIAGKFEEAQEEFKQILEDRLYRNTVIMWLDRIKEVWEGKISKEGLIHLFRGVDYCNKGIFGQCAAELREATKINPNDANTYESLGTAYRELGMWDEAVVEWGKAIDIDPTNTKAYINLGLYYEIKRMFDEAISEYKKALNIDPNNIDALVNLGAVYNSKTMLDDAILVLEKAINIDPDCAAAHNNLAVIYYQKGQYNLAIKHCDRAIELGVKVDPEFLEMLKPYR